VKVRNLKKGMVLSVESHQTAWLASGAYALPCGDSELRFVRKIMEMIVPGRCIRPDTLIVYLGSDRVKHEEGEYNHSWTETIRRVMIENEIAVVKGYNFKNLRQHPDFS
jgi:hypothetical protein